MLDITRDGSVLCVLEITHGWHDTKRSWWYYDLGTGMQSSTGKKGAVLDRQMTEPTRAWVQQYYVHKARPVSPGTLAREATGVTEP